MLSVSSDIQPVMIYFIIQFTASRLIHESLTQLLHVHQSYEQVHGSAQTRNKQMFSQVESEHITVQVKKSAKLWLLRSIGSSLNMAKSCAMQPFYKWSKGCGDI